MLASFFTLWSSPVHLLCITVCSLSSSWTRFSCHLSNLRFIVYTVLQFCKCNFQVFLFTCAFFRKKTQLVILGNSAAIDRPQIGCGFYNLIIVLSFFSKWHPSNTSESHVAPFVHQWHTEVSKYFWNLAVWPLCVSVAVSHSLFIQCWCILLTLKWDVWNFLRCFSFVQSSERQKRKKKSRGEVGVNIYLCIQLCCDDTTYLDYVYQVYDERGCYSCADYFQPLCVELSYCPD